MLANNTRSITLPHLNPRNLSIMITQSICLDPLHCPEFQAWGIEDVVDAEWEWVMDGCAVAEAGVPPGIAEAGLGQDAEGTGATYVIHIAKNQGWTIRIQDVIPNEGCLLLTEA